MKQWGINLALMLVSIFVVLAVLEVAVRIFTKPVYPILRTDPDIGTIMKPNVREYVWHNEPQKEVLVLTNSLGFVGDHTPDPAATNTTRIALLGDSTTASIEVDYFHAFPFLLQETLNAARPLDRKTVEVLNYGVGGTGTFLQYERYKKFVAPYHPKYVVVVFSENDFSDNLNKIQFDPENYGEAVSRNPGLKDFILQFQLPKLIFGKLQHNIYFLRLLNKLGLYELNQYSEKTVQGGSVTDAPEYYSFTFELLKRLRDRVESDGSNFLVILPTPPKAEIMEEWRKNESNRRLEEFFNKEHIQFLVPDYGVFAEEVMRQYDVDCVNWNCNGHMNEYGHQAMTQALFPYFYKMLFWNGR